MRAPDTSEFGRGDISAAAGDEARRGQMALARVAELERELELARHAQDGKVAELEERLGWYEANGLDLRAAVERRPWLGAFVSAWSKLAELVRKVRRISGA